MTFTPACLPGVWLIGLEPIEDERGFFARLWSAEESAAQGLHAAPWELNLSYNRRRGTLRGMHFQAPPHAEIKVVRCARGAIYDVALDLRSDSPTYRQWFAVELDAATRDAIYIPTGFAHGYQTLTDDAEVLYLCSHPYRPQSARRVRWNDPRFGIDWPAAVTSISEADRDCPDFHPDVLR